jgi:hypothetical protein
MKQKIGGPLGIGIAVVAAVIICVLLYMRFMNEPTLDPKVLSESRAGIDKTTERLRAAGIGGTGGAPNTPGANPGPPNSAPGNSGQGK